MVAKALSSADELNIDSYFREQPGSTGTVADESEEDNPDTSQQAPDEKPGKLSKQQADDDSDEDVVFEDEDDSEEGDEDSDEDEDESEEDDDLDEDEDLKATKKKKGDSKKEIEALKKQAKQAINAEFQRSQMQSERDTYKANFEKASSDINALTEKVEQLTKLTQKLTKKTEQSDSSGILTGDDDALITEGTLKKLLEKQAKSSRDTDIDDDERPISMREVKEFLAQQAKAESEPKTQNQQQPRIGSDLEAQRIWADGQSDVVEVTNYYTQHKSDLDPELATIPSFDGRYIAIRAKRLEAELKDAKKYLRKAKQKIKRMGKGELPETASGKRRKPSEINDKLSGDPLVNFFEK